MAQTKVRGLVQQPAVVRLVSGIARLQKAVAGSYVSIGGDGKAGIDTFQFIATGENRRGIGKERVLGRECYPVYAFGQRMSAVGFDGDELAGGMKPGEQFVRDEKRRFASRQHHMAGWMGSCRRGYFGGAHRLPEAVVRIAESTLQVAAGETDEYGRGTGMVAFALQ